MIVEGKGIHFRTRVRLPSGPRIFLEKPPEARSVLPAVFVFAEAIDTAADRFQYDDVSKATKDAEYRAKLMKEYKLVG